MPVPVASIRTPMRGALDRSRSLNVGGLTPYSAAAYPGRPAAVVYVQGCPWKCGYCHNAHLQLQRDSGPLEWARILKSLEKQAGVIQAVLFSGGEPTADPALPQAVRDVRRLGLHAGMHTAGISVDILEAVLPLLDWVALDIKAPFARYDVVTGVAGSAKGVRDCAAAILASGVRHEFRTTVHPSLLSEADLQELARDLTDLRAHSLHMQAFRPQGCRNKKLRGADINGYPSRTLLDSLRATFPELSYLSE